MAKRDLDSQLDDAFEGGRYKSAYNISLKLMKEFPDKPKYPLTAATSLFQMGKRREALTIVRDAVRRFPEFVVLRLIQIPLEGSLEGSDKAEQCCRETLDLLPPDAREIKAQVLNLLGTALWDQRRKEEALDVWRSTVKEFPDFQAAAENLREHTNEYGEPKTVHAVMDDLNHFSAIHIRRYLAERGQTEFISKEEVAQVYGTIHLTWGEQIVPRKEETDRMTAAEKTALYESVTVDFSRKVDTASFQQSAPGQSEVARGETAELSEDLLNEMDAIFPYLPSGGGLLALCAVPLLILCGLKDRRFKALLDGKQPTEKEKDLLIWGVDVAGALLTRLIEKPGNKPDISEALEIAMERLPEPEAREAIDFVVDLLMKGFDVPKPEKKVSKGRRGRDQGSGPARAGL
jgi:tetratricopeptide (TPR) repeat protein